MQNRRKKCLVLVCKTRENKTERNVKKECVEKITEFSDMPNKSGCGHHLVASQTSEFYSVLYRYDEACPESSLHHVLLVFLVSVLLFSDLFDINC
jgi:hypothetical protein